MPRRTIDRDEWEDDDEDWGHSIEGDDSDDEDSTVPCPYCHRPIPEDVLRCPYCENYISDEDAPPARKPLWIIIGVLACLYIVYRWTAG
jgi:hypothetical protein